MFQANRGKGKLPLDSYNERDVSKDSGKYSVLTVCDREGDFYEFFSEAADLEENFLVRIVRNRMADHGKKIFNERQQSPVAGSMVVKMSRNPKEHIPSRNVKMNYHYKEVVVHCPKRRKEKHLRIQLQDEMNIVAEMIRLEAVGSAITERVAKREKTERFLVEVEKRDGLLTEFNEEDWYSLVEYATVYSREDIRFTFKNGMEIRP